MRVLVTGGANGLGAGLVRHFAAAGHDVAFADLDADAGARLTEETGALFVLADVGVFSDNVAAVEQCVERFGGLDAVCLNAGVAGQTTVGADFDAARYRRAMQVNLDGVVYGFNAALPALSGRGSVLITSSLAGIAPALDVYYSAAKHALIGLTRSFAMRLHQDGVRVNAICPGFVDTRAIATVREALTTHWLALADPAEIAAVAADILEAGETGQVWQVQAGRRAELMDFPRVTLSRDDEAGQHP